MRATKLTETANRYNFDEVGVHDAAREKNTEYKNYKISYRRFFQRFRRHVRERKAK